MTHYRQLCAAAALLLSVISINAGEASISPTVRFLSTMGKASGLTASHSPASRNAESYIPLIIRLDSPDATLPDYATELHRRGDLSIVMVPEDRISEFGHYKEVERLETRMAAVPSLSSARQYCQLPQIAGDNATPFPLDGTGVVVGFADSGFDPNHVNFLDNYGETRIRRMVDYTFTSPTPGVYTTPQQIEAVYTDNSGQYHATHVAGILTGSYSADNMHGVATGADIVATTSPLQDAFLLAGCEEVIAYAKSQDKPAVINISISSMTGPHDGTTLFNRYMESLTEDATVCISAANEATRTGYLSSVTTDAVPSVRTYFRQYPTLSPLHLSGTVDIWSDRPEPFTVNLLTQDFNTFEITRIPVTLDPAAGKNEWMIGSHEYTDAVTSLTPAEMPENFFGYIHAACEVNPENNRYNVTLNCAYEDYINSEASGTGDTRMLFGVEVVPQSAGTHIEIYSTSGIYFTKHGDRDPSCAMPSGARTINDFCTGDGPICVGSFDTRTSVTNVNGEELTYPRLNLGGVSYFSSYATLDNGTVLPHICAPGAQVVSSVSKYYCEEHPEYTGKEVVIKRTVNGRENHWAPEQGTSMSSPFAAGVAALWLQANPELTGKQVRDIMLATAAKPTVDPTNPQWGQGMLDAAAGLAMARDMASIKNISQSGTTPDMNIAVAHGQISVSLPSTVISTLTLVTPDGTVCHKATPGTYDTTIDTSVLTPGIYILTATDTPGHIYSSKVAIR